jgi:hypothetical protein
MKISIALAVAFGIFLPAADTVRRWHTWRDDPVTLLDDYVLGAVLLSAAWFAGRNPRKGQRFLACAWGITLGVGYGGIVGQLRRLQTGEPDPAPISSEWVAVIKFVLLALALVAIAATLRDWPATNKLDAAAN